ncbi:hypothetical protein F7725_019193 [Dissostichus mawsoni]|uniref:Uncharacterized protein n=1 Tax=Dissostichus mawsoni TaxID=36200 RepID=A0A7J5YJ05_DISMA|nr:hypothetical protein F7725_019193 [Dissostichus mawsoni]
MNAGLKPCHGLSQASIIGRGGWRLDGCFVLLHLVYCEFNRVVGKNLKDNFLDALDRFSPSLMDLFRKKKGVTGQFLMRLIRRCTIKTPLGIFCVGENPQLNPSSVAIV